MISRYGIFCKVLELGSFTRAAQCLGYSQSSVSQTIKTMENELGVTLIDRKKDGIGLTPDGEEYFPYIQAVYAAEKALKQKENEMAGLENTTIRIGTFTSVSRTLLPPLMKSFQKEYPTVTFVLRQGEYTGIEQWISEGSVDLGFVCADAVTEAETHVLYEDEMMAVLPPEHPLAGERVLSLPQLAGEPFILLDEGDYSVSVESFHRRGLAPRIKYQIYDDYTILAMVKQGLGISFLYTNVLRGFDHGTEVRPLDDPPRRKVALAWKNRSTMPYAARRFADFVIQNAGK